MPIIRSNAIRIKRFRNLKQDLRTRRNGGRKWGTVMKI